MQPCGVASPFFCLLPLFAGMLWCETPHQVCACVQADGGSNAENLALNVLFSSLLFSSLLFPSLLFSSLLFSSLLFSSLLFSPVCVCAGRWREQCRELSTAKHSGPAAYGSSILLGPAHALGAGPVRCSFVRWCMRLFVCSFVRSFVRSFPENMSSLWVRSGAQKLTPCLYVACA